MKKTMKKILIVDGQTSLRRYTRDLKRQCDINGLFLRKVANKKNGYNYYWCQRVKKGDGKWGEKYIGKDEPKGAQTFIKLNELANLMGELKEEGNDIICESAIYDELVTIAESYFTENRIYKI